MTQQTLMNIVQARRHGHRVRYPVLAVLVGALVVGICASAVAATDDLKTIDSPGGGRILYGTLAGQPTPQSAMGQVLQSVRGQYGGRPQVVRVLRDRSGTLVAAFFNVDPKNEEHHAITGLAIVSVPSTGKVKAAVLSDDADRFRSTLKPMFQTLRAQVSANPSEESHASANAETASRAAAALRPIPFPDGTGVIGLPVGWSIVNAHGGDVLAKGPKGEVLRFGLAVPVLDPNNPQSRALWPGAGRGAPPPGNFVGIPYGTDAATAFKSASAQLAQKRRRPPPAINITKVQELPMSGGSRGYGMEGDVDQHDGQGAMQMVAQVAMSQPLAVGGWQMTIYEIVIPKALYAEESATLPAIFHSYKPNEAAMMGQIRSEMIQTQRITDQTMHNMQAQMDASDRQTAGFCDYLLGNSVVRDNAWNAHGRTSDYFADALVQADPNRFEVVPVSQYVKGIDY